MGLRLYSPRTYKQFINQILSLPVTVADLAVYILSGAMLIEAVIHKKTLVLFGSICGLDEDSIEKRVARKQLCVKNFDSITVGSLLRCSSSMRLLNFGVLWKHLLQRLNESPLSISMLITTG